VTQVGGGGAADNIVFQDVNGMIGGIEKVNAF